MARVSVKAVLLGVVVDFGSTLRLSVLFFIARAIVQKGHGASATPPDVAMNTSMRRSPLAPHSLGVLLHPAGEDSSGGTTAYPGDLKDARHARCATVEPGGGARCGY
jgi:hypothetical protein